MKGERGSAYLALITHPPKCKSASLYYSVAGDRKGLGVMFVFVLEWVDRGLVGARS